MGGERTGRPQALDVLVALGVAALVAALCRAAAQERLLADGAGLATFCAEGRRFVHQVLYLPACRLVAPLAAADDPLAAPRLLSALAAGVGAGASLLLARACGATRAGAVAGAALLAASPGVAFFGTAIEVHALHLAVAALALLAIARLPWERPALALPAAAACAGAVLFAHPVGVLLGPGLVVLVGAARARVGAPFRPRTLALVVGPALLAGLASAALLGAVLRGEAGGTEAEIVTGFARPPGASRFLVDGALVPLGLLVPAALVGAWRLRGEPRLLAALSALALVPLAALAVWGVAERGGYVLGSAPAWCVLAARGLDARPARAALVGLPLVALQLVAAAAHVRAYDRGFSAEARVALVRAHLGEDGLLVTAVDTAPAIRLWLPRVEEVSLYEAAARAELAGAPPEAFAAAFLPAADALLARHGRALVDLGFRGQHDRPTLARLAPWLEAAAASLAERYDARPVEHDDWPMLLLRPR